MQVNHSTLSDLLHARRASASAQRGITHILGEEDEQFVSYAQLYERALSILFHLQDRGVKPGDPVVICTSSNVQFLDGFWACQLGGFMAVPVTPGQSQQHRQKFFNIYEQLDNPCVFTNRPSSGPLEAYAREHGLRRVLEDMAANIVVAEDLTAELAQGVIHQGEAQDIALVQFSSGSTGSPKGVLLSHENLLSNLAAMHEGLFISEQDSWLCWAPLYHDMGLIACHLEPLYSGIEQYFLPTERFARRPLSWLQTTSAKKATLITAPNFGFRHFLRAFAGKGGAEKMAAVDLSHVRIVFSAAEPISAELCRDFQKALAPYGLGQDIIHPTYGLAEGCVAVSFNKTLGPLATRIVDRRSLGLGRTISAVADRDEQIELVGTGHAVPDCEFRLVNESNEPVEDGVVGLVQIRGGNVTRGYYGVEERRGPNDWLDTGDLGLFADQLYIVGRAKETIILNGVTYHPHDLESLVSELDSIGPDRAVCVSVWDEETQGEVLAVFVVFRGAEEDFVGTIRAVRHALSEAALIDARYVLPVKTLPRTSSGKLQRFSLADAFQAGEFDQLWSRLNNLAEQEQAHITEAGSEVERAILEICRTHITTIDIGVTDDILDMGASSLSLVEICESVDEAYPGILDLPDFLEHTNVASLAAFVTSRLKEAS